MSESEEDEYCGDDYEGFEGWKDRYVNGGKRLWGTGNCFDFCSRGICFGCDYNHPQLTLRVTAAGVEARPKRLAPWCQALEALKFKYQGDDKFLHATISPEDAVNGLLSMGVKRPHFDLVGEGLKSIKLAFQGQEILEEMRGELLENPDAEVLVHPSGLVVYREGVDQATIDAARAAMAPVPAPAPASSAGYESDGSKNSGILASDYEGPGANRRGNVGADSKDAFDDEAALALVAAAEEAEAAKTKEADDVIDWDAVGAAADAAQAEHDAKRARVL